jgi:GMP synthase (glutamine-hydrolysing)|tara:strand:- start:32673 stop:34226 length:1554 start_codon:yes stop_codon:yes gene_type:complete
MNIHGDRLLILDFGSQYTQLIARRVRQHGVYSEILPCDVDPKRILAFDPKGVILSGGPESATSDTSWQIPSEVFSLGVPILGICYGMQALAQQLGGRVESSQLREFGHAELTMTNEDSLFAGLSDSSTLSVWMSHGDRVVELPEGFTVIGSSEHAPIAAMADTTRNIYGLQFHPEVTHTESGSEILAKFAHNICGCGHDWTPENIIEDAIAKVKQQVGDGQVLLGLSGGVDSSVVAALLHQAIGDQLVCVFVDNGLLRLDEGAQVMETFNQNFGLRVIRADAEERFLTALKGEADPERKRKIIGRTFIEVFEEEASKLSDIRFLAQGTIYPDVIESAGAASGKAHVIKSHHNVGGLPDNMRMALVEPLCELFKDEVRVLGVTLGLPPSMVYRHPFPGPGLGVRILGKVDKESANILRRADHIFIEELRAAELYDSVSQAFAVFLPVKSVGVVGDQRRYASVIALRAVETIDFMTARWAHLPYEFIERVSGRIINEIEEVSRVVYDVSSKPPATIEWE